MENGNAQVKKVGSSSKGAVVSVTANKTYTTAPSEELPTFFYQSIYIVAAHQVYISSSGQRRCLLVTPTTRGRRLGVTYIAVLADKHFCTVPLET
jgi:hypothetical protein